jgi:parallel beta-helix repeat protein
MPVINGLSNVTGWESAGNGIYRARVNYSGKLNLVLLNGKPVALGRYPNSGYLHFQSHSGTSSITDKDLPGTPNWTGAEVVIRANHWILDRNLITSHSGGTLKFEPSSKYEPRDGFGYFIQSDIRTLDLLGEWFFEKNYLYMYFGSASPSSYKVEAGTIDILANMQVKRFLVFDGIEFRGAADMAIYVDYSENVTIQNCKITFSGAFGIEARGAKNLKVIGNHISHCLSVGVKTRWGSDNSVFIENTITDIGMLPGMGGSADGTYNALSPSGVKDLIQYNHIERIGYLGISFKGDQTIVENNFINRVCQIKDDGGGIYSFVEDDTEFRYTGVKIRNNIILNSGGYREGEGVAGSRNQAEGIYTDGLTNSFEITGNTIAYAAASGIFLNTPRWHHVHGNTVISNKVDQIHLQNLKMKGAMPGGNKIENNIVFSTGYGQQQIKLSDGPREEILNFGSSDNNKFINYDGSESSFHTITYSNKWDNVKHTLPEWREKLKQDLNSHELHTKTVYLFEYNASKKPKRITFNHPLIDVHGKKHYEYIEIAPYSSVILFFDLNIYN